MDRERFDALTRMFATKGSRRAAFAGLLSAALLGGGAEVLAKSSKGNGKRRGHGKDRGHSHDKGRDTGHGQGRDRGQDGAQQRAASDELSDANLKTADHGSAAPERDDVQVEASPRGASKSRGKGRGNGKGQNRGKGKGKGRNNKRSSGRNQTQAEATRCCGAKACALPTAGSNRYECNFAGQPNLAGRTMTGVNFGRIDGRKTNFSNANVRGANFGEACLQGAIFRGADVSSANFGKACLFLADFTGARNLNVSVNFATALLCGVILPDGTVGAIGNRDCNKATACCQMCLDPGQSGCNAVGGRCCGGAVCQNDTCDCPPDKPKNCNGSCKQCCANGDCPNQVCCEGVCCANNETCQNGKCVGGCQPPCDPAQCKVCNLGTGACDTMCGANETCLNGSCCPNTRVCGSVCLARTCDAAQCETCNPTRGSCETCSGSQHCCSGACKECCTSAQCTADPSKPICNGSGQCVPCAGNPSCATAGKGNLCCQGRCFTGNCCATDDPSNPPICPAGEQCTSHVCSCGSSGASCRSGFTCCQGTCVNEQMDPNHCGDCGATCSGTSDTCVEGRCACGSAPPCTGGKICTNGECVCPANQIFCNGACQVGNCCPTSGDRAGQAVTCDNTPTSTCCATGCVNTRTSNSNCGGCGTTCPAHATCSAGVCQCDGDYKPCGDVCIVTSSCCTGTTEGCTEPDKRACCTGTCVNTQTDPANCGDCGQTCPANTICTGGACLCTAESCTGGCCSNGPGQEGACQTSNNDHCGLNGDRCVPCPAGQDCSNGTCAGCQPKTCADFPNQCGAISDGCTHTLNCACPMGCCDTATQTCQPGTEDGLCGVGGADCNRCTPPQTCGGGGASGVCGDSCGGCPDGQTCVGGHCCPTAQQCNGGCCPSGAGCVNGQCCPGPRICASGCCPEGQTCLGTTCCAPANICGGTCLATPCNIQLCETCNPLSGTCEVCGGPDHCLRCISGTCFSTCRFGQICAGDDRCICTAESCPNGRCMDDNTCCPNANVCGDACLPAPCDLLQRCETCNPETGTCEVCGGPGNCLRCISGTCFSTCPPGTLCDGNERCAAPCASDADCPSGDWCRAGNPNTCRAQIASGGACAASFCAAPNCLQCAAGPGPCPSSQVCP